MENDRKKITEQNLIRCAKEEFLQKGYAKANLRDICRRAGVTTGAFYFSFASKEALLDAILAPTIAGYTALMSAMAQREIENPETAEQNEQEIVTYLCSHRQECELLLEKCAGSKYEAFREQLLANMQDAFGCYYEKYLGFSPDPELVRIMAGMRFHGYIELIRGDNTMDECLRLARAIGIHADAGTAAMIEYLKNNAHQ